MIENIIERHVGVISASKRLTELNAMGWELVNMTTISGNEAVFFLAMKRKVPVKK